MERGTKKMKIVQKKFPLAFQIKPVEVNVCQNNF